MNLSSGDTTEATVPPTVTIGAGQSFVFFAVSSVDDSIVDGTQTVTISASAANYNGGSTQVNVTDDDLNSLSVTVNPSTFSEAAGSGAATGTVTRTGSIASSLTVNLSSGDATEATVPPIVTIGAWQSSATFAVSAVDDSNLDGMQVVIISVSAANYKGGSTPVNVTDNDVQPAVNVRLAVTDLLGQPISQILAGQGFLLQAYVEALRAGPDPSRQGVFAAYLDVNYDPVLVTSLVHDVSGIAFGDYYVHGKRGDFSTPGLINEVGAFWGGPDSSYCPPDRAERLLFSIHMQAVSAGDVRFTGDSADGDGMEVLVCGQPAIVAPPEAVQFFSATLKIAATPPDATITGTIGDDADGDGVRDSGESASAGWKVFLDQNNNGQWDAGEPTTLTASDNPVTLQNETGTYTFTGLAPGVYTVAEVMQPDWTQTHSFGNTLPEIGSSAQAVFEGYELGEGTSAPGGVVLSQADIEDGNPFLGGQPYRYLDGWNRSPRVPAEYYDGVGETAWTPGGHAGIGATVELWNAFDTSHPEWYAFDFAGYEYDHATFVTDSALPRYGHEDRWYDGSGGSWTLWDIRNVANPVTVATGTLGELHLDIGYGFGGTPRTEGTSIITVAGGSVLYQELVSRWGTAQLNLRLLNDGGFLRSVNPSAAEVDKWAIFGFEATLTPVRADSHTVVLDVGQAAAGVDFGNAKRPWHNPGNPFDVDGQSVVSALDVLIMINYINFNLGQTTLPSAPVEPHPFYDVNGDDACSTLDVLMVINYINSRSPGAAGEGEAAAVTLVYSSAYQSAAAQRPAANTVLPQTADWRDVESEQEAAALAAWSMVMDAEADFAGDRGLARGNHDGKTSARPDINVLEDVLEIDRVLTDIAGDVARGWNQIR